VVSQQLFELIVFVRLRSVHCHQINMKFNLVAVLLACGVLGSVRADPEITDYVVFDITMGNNYAGQIVIGLFGNDVPKTVENFKALASEGVCKNGRPVQYAGSIFHRVIKNFMIQGGDVVSGNGFGSASKFGEQFEDENFNLRHEGPGYLSMANSGPNSNGSQFFLTLIKTGWLDGKHVVFGKVVNGMDVVNEIGQTRTDRGDKPREAVKIIESKVCKTPNCSRPSDGRSTPITC